uniref:Uncharacterized protein n=1 Tax=Arundo donax TaxID=35708 RepID=A0A0A9DI86_ARUDO
MCIFAKVDQETYICFYAQLCCSFRFLGILHIALSTPFSACVGRDASRLSRLDVVLMPY